MGWSLLEKTARSGVWLFWCALSGSSAFFAFAAFADWEEEEETETEEEQPLRFQGPFRPRRFFQGQCWGGGGARARSRTRATSSTQTCRDSGDGL